MKKNIIMITSARPNQQIPIGKKNVPSKRRAMKKRMIKATDHGKKRAI